MNEWGLRSHLSNLVEISYILECMNETMKIDLSQSEPSKKKINKSFSPFIIHLIEKRTLKSPSSSSEVNSAKKSEN